MNISKYIKVMMASALLTVGSVANGAIMVDDSFNNAVSKLIANMRTAVSQEAANLNGCVSDTLEDCPYTKANSDPQTISGESNQDATYTCHAAETTITNTVQDENGNDVQQTSVVEQGKGTVICTANITPVVGYDGSPALVTAVATVTASSSFNLTSNDAVENKNISCNVDLTGKARQSEAGAAFDKANLAIAQAAIAYVVGLGCTTS